MINIEKQSLINSLQNNQVITVMVNFYHPLNGINSPAITATVHKGITTCGKAYFYAQPIGDSHPGASITKYDIDKILSFIS